MTEVKIPFMERFREPMLNGTKTVTSRTKKYGVKGDWFRVFGAKFVIDRVDSKPLGYVAAVLWEPEGAISNEEFIEIWGKIHPRKGWLPSQMVYVHLFHKEGYLKSLADAQEALGERQKELDCLKRKLRELIEEIKERFPVEETEIEQVDEETACMQNILIVDPEDWAEFREFFRKDWILRFEALLSEAYTQEGTAKK